ncbi:MAG: ThuA domain-containing protein [Candidatus Acidiferrales bacterium]
MTKKRSYLLFMLVALLAAVVATAQNPVTPGRGGFPGGRGGRGRGPRNMKTLLIWSDTRNGIAQHDSTSHAMAVIEELGYETGTYFSYIRTDSNVISYKPQMTTGQPASGGPSLANVDAIFFLGHREVPIDAAQKADLLKFVHEDGKGFVAAHVATTAFLDWPEFGDMLGGRFDQHPWGQTDAKIIVEDPAFPGMQFFPRVFGFHDEFYQIKDFSPEKSRVLMRLDTSTLDMKRQGVQAADAPYAITWAKTYGKGRVFYSALGHDASTWDNPDIRRMWFNAIEWALGLKDADVTPQPVSTTTPDAVEQGPGR